MSMYCDNKFDLEELRHRCVPDTARVIAVLTMSRDQTF